MIRRYNYTNRVRLPRKTVAVTTFTAEDGVQAFSAEMNFSEHELPTGARIYLEAYYRNAMMRFPVAEVNGNEHTYTATGRLTDLQDPQVNFRVKVVDESEMIGRIVAMADKIQTFNQDAKQVMRVGLLPVKLTDLGDQIWMLEIPDDGTDPVLCLNQTLVTGDIPITELVRNNPMFRTLVFPQVVRQIFAYMLFDMEGDTREDDPEHWANRWMRWALRLRGVEAPTEHDDVDEKRLWIDGIVQRFCIDTRVRSMFERYITEIQQ